MLTTVFNDKDILTASIILLVYKELNKIDPSYADSYIYYSVYRREVGVKANIF